MRRLGIALACFGVAIVCANPANAAALERDLGSGLIYWRIHSISDDLPSASDRPGKPCVLDLRFVKGGEKEAATLLSWLRARAGVRKPVLLLANASTSGVILAPLDPADSVLGLLVIGPKAPQFEPDVSVPVSAEADRRGYNALQAGASVDSLISDNEDKPRNDEARLEKERTQEADDTSGEAAPASASAPSVSDPVLRRAVQIHRGMLALRRL